MKSIIKNINKKFICACIICICACTLHAQTREQQLQQIQQYRDEVFKAFTVFFNPSASESVRISAVSRYPVALDEKQLLQCVSVAQNVKESDAIRATALERTQAFAGSNANLYNSILQWITDKEHPILRAASLDNLELVTVGGVDLKGTDPQTLDVLRGLLNDKDHDFRIRALGILLNKKDEYTKQLIIQNIVTQNTSMFSLDESLGCLYVFPKFSNDLYAAIYKIMNMREISLVTKANCIRLVGAYSPAQQQILSIYQDAKQPVELRTAALNNLQVSHKDKLKDYLTTVVLNESDNEDLRIMSITLMKYVQQSKEVRMKTKKLDGFSEQVAALSGTTKSEKVRIAASDYVLHVNSKYK